MTDKSKKPSLDADYAVGYGRPPVHTRFQPGRSGNPKGRPRGSKNFSTLVDEELAKRVTVLENGKPRTMTMREALVKRLVNRAVGGDPRAITLVLDQERQATQQKESQADALGLIDYDKDARAIQNVIKRLQEENK